MAAELKGAIGNLILIVLIPFFFVFVITLIFWSARRSAEREE